MKTEEITVANLKCNGCASTIKKELLKIEGIKSVEVTMEKDTIKLLHGNVSRNIIIDKLPSMVTPRLLKEMAYSYN